MNDKRYTIRPEWCGYVEPRFVVRFCNTWIGQRTTRSAALVLAAEHNANRL